MCLSLSCVCQSSVGSVYEAGQLNLLSMLELLHQALGLLGEERVKMAGHTPIAQLHPLLLQERNLQMARALEDLRLMRWVTVTIYFIYI